MDGGGKVIFDRRSIGLTLFIVAGLIVVAVIIAVSGNDVWIGMQVGGISIAIALAAAYFGSRWAGKKQLARIVLDGDDLMVQRVHFLDRGEIIRIPREEIENWSVKTLSFKGEAYSELTFECRGDEFSFYLSADAKPDFAAIEALVPASVWKRA